MARGYECAAHKHAAKVSYEDHHVWPKEYHGPSTPENMVRVCCNAHSDIHYLLNILLRGKPYDPKDYGPAIRDLAKRGHDAIMAYANSLSPVAGARAVAG